VKRRDGAQIALTAGVRCSVEQFRALKEKLASEIFNYYLLAVASPPRRDPVLQERRQYQRLTPSSPQLVLLDESKYSLLFDICEGGLAVEGFAARNPNSVFSLEFDLPEGNGCIQAKAEIVWTSDSGYRTGFRFLDLAETSRQHLRDWISSAMASRLSVMEGESAQPLFASAPSDSFQRSAEAENGKEKELKMRSIVFPVSQTSDYKFPNFEEGSRREFDEEHAPTYLAGILLAVVMASVAFLMGYYWRSSRPRPRVPHPVTVAQPAPSAGSASSELATNLAPLDVPGFVLQVGAMSQEANADVFSAALHKKNFAAFVFRHSNDRLYRVAVGPFPNEDAALETKRQLEAQGFSPILKPWSPE
jgi:hypothetical protein